MRFSFLLKLRNFTSPKHLRQGACSTNCVSASNSVLGVAAQNTRSTLLAVGSSGELWQGARAAFDHAFMFIRSKGMSLVTNGRYTATRGSTGN